MYWVGLTEHSPNRFSFGTSFVGFVRMSFTTTLTGNNDRTLTGYYENYQSPNGISNFLWEAHRSWYKRRISLPVFTFPLFHPPRKNETEIVCMDVPSFVSDKSLNQEFVYTENVFEYWGAMFTYSTCQFTVTKGLLVRLTILLFDDIDFSGLTGASRFSASIILSNNMATVG